MTSCDDFEVAVEQRLHGALDAAGAARLADHLSSCAGCRAFETRSRELEDAMRTHAARMSDEVDWKQLGESLDRWRRQLLGGTWKGLAAIFLSVPFLALAFGYEVGGLSGLVSGIIGGLTVVVWGRIAARRAIAEARQAERASGQLLLFMRGQLDKLIRLEKQNALVLPFLALLPLYGPLSREITPWSLFGAAMLMVLMVGLALRSRFIVLPRLRRERAELD